MAREIKIGTRDSELALWQAMQVKGQLDKLGQTSRIIPVKSEGDRDLTTPLYAMGTTGIFTRALDEALLNLKIDLAVHSLKDVPTQAEKGILQVAVLPRGPYRDVLVARESLSFLDKAGYTARIATGSLRRKAQWLNRYPAHQVEPLRGNIRSRLNSLQDKGYDGAIFAEAALERLGLEIKTPQILEWMISAPAQGAVAVMAREEDMYCFDICRQFNDEVTTLCVKQERDFLKALEGGCSAPIGAYSWIEDEWLHFRGNLLSPDGTEKMEIERSAKLGESFDLGKEAANELLAKGAEKILSMVKNVK